MFFLNEHLIAAFLSIMAFCVSMIACFFFKIGIHAMLFRSLIFAFIFLFAGFLFGRIIKNLIVEAFVTHAKDKEEDEHEEDTDTDVDEKEEEAGKKEEKTEKSVSTKSAPDRISLD